MTAGFGREAAGRTPSVSCVFVCHDGSGRVLLARRGAGARDEPGTWDTGAGALEFGETFEAAVRREVGEEYATRPLDITTLGVRNVLRARRAARTAALPGATDPGTVRPDWGRPAARHRSYRIGFRHDLPSVPRTAA
ncbi:NUDIX domain-containing protein [Micromonospora sp. NPDC004704]